MLSIGVAHTGRPQRGQGVVSSADTRGQVDGSKATFYCSSMLCGRWSRVL